MSPRAAVPRAKRILDLVLALLGGLVLLPVILVIALLVHLFLGKPVLFRQPRPGIGGLPFTLYKFRTMRDVSGPDGQPLPAAQRLTGFGRLLRATSKDELPELWNVLRGEMTVTPRNNSVATSPYPASPAGHRSMAATTSPGKISSPWTFGM